MSIDYDHSRNQHSSEGPRAAFPRLRQHLPSPIRSLVDVGCGTGVWLQAARENGIEELAGFDGVVLPADRLLVPASLVRQHDLSTQLDWKRRYDVALCLEVAEHLDASAAPTIVHSLVNLADIVVFSAACPSQRGQHHVNCQWPEYWQNLFNQYGFACDDAVRWTLWGDPAVEPWYRQNMFIARCNPSLAGLEPRIAAVRHPDLPPDASEAVASYMEHVEDGGLAIRWYLATPLNAIGRKVVRWSRARFSR
jgi:hypothetical protein